jgi:TRAP-type C4-dicarboxylate transport system substrate-binding protein
VRSAEKAQAVANIISPFRAHLVMMLALALFCPCASAQQTLLLTTMSPAGQTNITQLFQPWADRVNAQAGGSITVEPRAGTILANFGNVFGRVQDDVVQIGWALHGVIAGRFPLSEVGVLPFIANNAREASIAYWRLYKSGVLDAEYGDTIPLMFGLGGPFYIHFVKPPNSLTDLSGVKLSASSKAQSEIAQRLGATPISTTTNDLYESLQRGMINGALISWGAFNAYKLGEVTNFHVEVPLGMTPGMIFMSRKKYDALPPAARKAIEDNSGEIGSRGWGRYLESLTNDQREIQKNDSKRKVVTLTPEQEAQWRRALEPLAEAWASRYPDGPKVLAAYKALLEEVRAETRN